MLNQFFQPYQQLSELAAWGLAQNLEGLDLFVYLNSKRVQAGNSSFYLLNLNPDLGIAVLSSILSIVLFAVVVINIRACFYLKKKLGYASIVLWSIPGMMSFFGWFPDISTAGPDVFRFGKGFPGSAASAVANLFICLVGGWSFILLLGSRCDKNTFKNVYDHIWYPLGLFAAIYFIVDAGLPSYKADLAQADEGLVRSFNLYRTAEPRLDILCALPERATLYSRLCAIRPEIKKQLTYQIDSPGGRRIAPSLPDWVATLANDSILERQIAQMNEWACAETRQAVKCSEISVETLQSIEHLHTTFAFPPSIYAKTMLQFQASAYKANSRIHDIERQHNFRYFAFLGVAVLAGGKVANASRAVPKNELKEPRSWMRVTIAGVGKILSVCLRLLINLGSAACSRVVKFVAARRTRHEQGEENNAKPADAKTSSEGN